MKDNDSIMKRRRRFFAIMLAKTMICGLAVPKSSLAEIRQYDGEPECESKNNPEYEAYEGHAPHCYDDSNIKYYPNCKEGGYILSSCIYCGNDLEVTQVLPSDHAMTHVTAKDPTCTEDGNYEYWYCSKCHAYFEDADGETEYDIDLYKRPHLGHNITEQASRKEPTCTEPGNYAYSYCSECKKHFDENGKEFEDGGWVIPAAHKLTTTNANPATCTTDGNSAYSYCSECKKYFDASGEEINDGDWIIPAAHKLTLVEAQAATCSEKGHIEYYHCSECNKYFNDKNVELQLANLETAALGHDWENQWKNVGNGMERRYCRHDSTHYQERKGTTPDPLDPSNLPHVSYAYKYLLEPVYGDTKQAESYINDKIVAGSGVLQPLESKPVGSVSAAGADGVNDNLNQVNNEKPQNPDDKGISNLVIPQRKTTDMPLLLTNSDPNMEVAKVLQLINQENGGPFVVGGVADASVQTGDGNDTIFGGEGKNILIGGTGIDTITAGAGKFTISAGDGNDTLFGGAGKDTLIEDEGKNILIGGTGIDTITAGAGKSTISATISAGDGGNFIHFKGAEEASVSVDISGAFSNSGEVANPNLANVQGSVVGGVGEDSVKSGDGDDLFHLINNENDALRLAGKEVDIFTLDENAENEADISVDAGDGFDLLRLLDNQIEHTFEFKNGKFHMN